MTTIRVDPSDLRRFSRAVSRADTEVYRNMLAALRKSGDLVAADAQGRTATFSVRPRSAGPVVSVIKSGGNPGGAAALEHHGDPGDFRHPVFGNRDAWVSQAARPILHEALLANQVGVNRIVQEAMDEALRALNG